MFHEGEGGDDLGEVGEHLCLGDSFLVYYLVIKTPSLAVLQHQAVEVFGLELKAVIHSDDVRVWVLLEETQDLRLNFI